MCTSHPGAAPSSKGHGFRSFLGLPPTATLLGSFVFLTACTRGEVALLEKGSYGALRAATDIVSLGAVQSNGLLVAHPDSIRPADVLFNEVRQEQAALFVDDVFGPVKPRALHEEEETELSWSRSLNVVGAALAMGAVSLFGMFLPAIISKYSRRHNIKLQATIETMCTAFAAGAFWGLALVHMFLEAINALEGLDYGLHLGPDQSYLNAAFPLALLGYLVMLTVQNLAVTINNNSQEKVKGNDADSVKRLAIINGVVATVALTFHAFFEGLVTGMRDDATFIWIAAVSVMGHKWAESFSLAQRLRTTKLTNTLRYSFLAVFLVASPLGALVGLPLTTLENQSIVGVLNSLSAGILIFVAGHCTEDVFGCQCLSEDVLMTCAPVEAKLEPTASESRITKASSVVSEEPLTHGWALEHQENCSRHHSIHVQPHGQQAHSHGHGEAHCASDYLSSSYKIFAGRILLMFAGATLVFGMMCVHLTHSAHDHSNHAHE